MAGPPELLDEDHPVDFEAYRKEAITFFRGRVNAPWLKQYDEDFAQFCCLHTLSRSSTLEQFYIDFMRATMGEMRHPGGRLKARHRLGDSPNPEKIGVDPGDYFNLDQFLETLKLTQKERCILVLVYGWGFQQVEVAHAFGLTEGAITHALQAIWKKNRLRLPPFNGMA